MAHSLIGPDRDTPDGSGTDHFLRPESIAVVGASDNAARIGGRVVSYLKETFSGELYPVNPRKAAVQGVKAFASISETPRVPDLVIVLVDADKAVTVAEECGAIGVPACLIIAGGFDEIGGAGTERQEKLRTIARSSDMRIMGPNCVGFMNLDTGVRATFTSLDRMGQKPGRIAVLSQSGAMGVLLFNLAQSQGLGASRFITTGNEVDITVTEFLVDAVEDPDVDAIGLYLEGVNDPAALVSAARRAAELRKPIVVLKVGSSGAGARASVSHTGSLAGDDDVIEVVFSQFGLIRAASPDELVDVLKLAAAGRVPTGPRLGIFTSSGGLGIMLTDAAVARGLDVPETSPSTRDRLAALIPEYGSARNPVDVTAQVVNEQDKLSAAVSEMFRAPEFDAVCIAGLHFTSSPRVVPAVEDAMAQYPDVPAVGCTNFPDIALDMNERGMPCTTEAIRAVESVGHLYDMQLRRDLLLAEPVGERSPAPSPPLLGSRRGVVPEHESARLLRQRGLPVVESVVAGSLAEAKAAAEQLGWPVALKLSVDWMPHRSEHGGVQLDLQDADELSAAYRSLELVNRAGAPTGADSMTVVVSRMLPIEVELFCGGHRDPLFGPLVTVGIGGRLVELLAEKALLVHPFNRGQARRAIGNLAGGRLFGSARGLDEGALGALTELALDVGDLLVSEPEIGELDLNPITVRDGEILILDALIVTSSPAEIRTRLTAAGGRRGT